MNQNLPLSDKLAIFYVSTLDEFNKGELWSSLVNYLNSAPSSNYCFDLYIFLNKLIVDEDIALFTKTFSAHINIHKIYFIDLDLSSEDDTFWYPWSKTPRPIKIPRLGYTAGANSLFFNSLNLMTDQYGNYENFLMLEADTFPVENFWADSILEYIDKTDFLIAGSKYKGLGKEHYNAFYKDHLNGVAIYKNNEKLKKLLVDAENYIAANIPESGYYNFDVAINDFVKKEGLENDYNLLDSPIIVNVSDPRDKFITTKSIKETYKESLIVHQKSIPFYQQLRSSFFTYDSSREELLTFYCQPKCASEYVIDSNEQFLNNYCDQKNIFPLTLVFTTKNNSKIILFGYTENMDVFDKSMFNYVLAGYHGVDIYSVYKIIESGFFKPFSAVVDQRSSRGYDYSVFDQFHKICLRLNVSHSFYSFSRDPIESASSSFVSFKNMNKADPSISEKEQLYDYLLNHSERSFIAKNLIGKEDLNQNEFKFLINLIEDIAFYDLKLIDFILPKMFRRNGKISNEALLSNVLINHTINKISYHEELTSENIAARIKNKFSLANKLFKLSTINNVEEEKIPVFIHQPRCGGNFVNNIFTYFLKKIAIEKNVINMKNFKRLHVLMEDGVTQFYAYCIVHDDSFHSDPEIFLKPDNPFYAEADQTVFNKYVKDNAFELLAFSTTLSGKPILAFEYIKKVLNLFDYDYIPFMFLREARDQMESFLHNNNYNIKSLPDAWLLKKFFDYKESSNIQDIEYLEDVFEFIIDENILVRDLSLIENVVKEVLMECFRSKLPVEIIKNSSKGESKPTKKINSVHKRAITLSSKWNQEIYKKLIY